MRDTDRKIVSEAIRKQSLWRVKHRTKTFVQLETDYDELLSIGYGATDKIKYANYRHFDRETGECVCREEIERQKRQRVLHLIGACNRTHAKSAAT